MTIRSLPRVRRGLAAIVAAGAVTAGALSAPSPAHAAAPTNDDFASAAVLSGTSVSVIGSNVDATVEPGEPTTMGYQWNLGASVWYRWTAPVSADYAVSTAGSDFDTELNVYMGTAVNALTRVATDDDVMTGPGGTSATGFAATAGTTYVIQVAGYQESGAADTGAIHLALGQAAIAGSITYESDADAADDPLSGCLGFYTDLNDPSGSFVAGGCGSGNHGTTTAYAIGLVPAGTYYVSLASNDTTYSYLGADEEHALKLTIPGGGCTLTGFNLDLNTGAYTAPTGKSCPLAPACMSAKSSVTSATQALASAKAALAADQSAVKKFAKKLKKAKKHHKPTAKLSKKLKKAKKKLRAEGRSVGTAGATLAADQAKVTASC